MNIMHFLAGARGRAGTLSTAVLLGLSTAASGQASTEAPKNAEVNFKDIKVNGSGCPVGSTTEIITNEKPDKAFTYFQVTYDLFEVNLGPNAEHSSRKFCNIALAMEYPVGWQYTVVAMQTDGFAKIAEGAKGIFQSSYEFRGQENRQKLETKTLPEGYEGDYEVKAEIDNEKTVWSTCDSRIPLNIKSTIWLSGSEATDSVMTVDVQSGLLSQTYEIKWKKCAAR